VEPTKLGRLQRVEAREVWTHEALSFTPWLRANIGLLGEALGLDLEVEAEVAVGSFSVDLAGKDLGSGRPLIVENQLQQTDHSHLGQLLTYAAGLDAAVAVWIAPRIRDEHRQALDWLNAHTDAGLDFFGVELELLRVQSSATEVSPPAPHFKVVAQPNEWAKTARHAVTSGAPSSLGLRYQEFLDAVLRAYKMARPGVTNASRVGPQNWLSFSAGRSGFSFNWSFPSGGRFSSELYIDAGDQAMNKGYFDLLLAQKEAIEARLSRSIVWERLDNRRASRLAVRREIPESPPFEENEELKAWAVETMIDLTDTLRPIVKTL
jgi:hypothetical protein